MTAKDEQCSSFFFAVMVEHRSLGRLVPSARGSVVRRRATPACRAAARRKRLRASREPPRNRSALYPSRRAEFCGSLRKRFSAQPRTRSALDFRLLRSFCAACAWLGERSDADLRKDKHTPRCQNRYSMIYVRNSNFYCFY